MKSLIAALLLAAAAIPARASYLDTIVSDYKHPKLSASMLYTPKLDFDGGVTDVALIYHKADPKDSLWPQKLIDAGVPALSWTLLESGVGGNRQTAFLDFGASVDVAPTLLSPLTNALAKAGGKAAVIGALIVSPDGNGVKIGISWKGNVVTNYGLTRFDELRFSPRFKIGYNYQF